MHRTQKTTMPALHDKQQTAPNAPPSEAIASLHLGRAGLWLAEGRKGGLQR